METDRTPITVPALQQMKGTGERSLEWSPGIIRWRRSWTEPGWTSFRWAIPWA